MNIIEKGPFIIIIIVCIFIAYTLGVPCFNIDTTKEVNLSVNIMTIIISLINLLIVYTTLSNQSRERFEMTLFNLLENHRKMKSSINLKMSIKDIFMRETIINNDNERLFIFAIQEIIKIKQFLKRTTFPYIPEEEVQNELEIIGLLKEMDQSTVEKAVLYEKELSLLFSLSQRCFFYSISKEMWAKPLNSEEKLNEKAYQLFFEKWEHELAPYFRSLILLFKHIENSSISLIDKVTYRSYVINQMSNSELELLSYHYLHYAKLHNDYTFKDSLDAISPNYHFIVDRYKTNN